MLTRRCCLLAASLSLLLAVGATAQEDSYRTARVSDVSGELAAKGFDEDDASYLELNAIIRPGDVLWTDDRGNAEIELERGAWVRLAEDTKLEVHELPPSGEFRLWTGSVYFDLSERIEEPLRVRTPVGDVELFPESVARIDLSGDESARVSLYAGRAAVVGEGGGAIRLNAGDRAYLEPGRGEPDIRAFDREDLDGFDEYHRRRMDYFVARPLPDEIEEPIIGAYDLADHGSWVVVEDERYWRPRVEEDWRPYSDGYWSWVPGCGYSWVDYRPWGYTTSHYGRWQYRPVHGWLWSPRYSWGPAWVHWSSFDDYYGWAPLDPWDRPCYYGSGAGFGFNIGFGGSNWFIDYRSWSFCGRNDFYFGRHHRRFWGGRRRGFHHGREINLNPGRFRLVKNAHRDFGVPQRRVRGLVNSERGWSARERVLRLEDRLPEKRRRLIESRFKTPAGRDRDVLRRGGSGLDRLQRDRNEPVDDSRLVRGDDAERLIRSPRGGRNGGERLERGGNGSGLPDRGGDRANRPGRNDDAAGGSDGFPRRGSRGGADDRNTGERPRVDREGNSGGLFDRGGRRGGGDDRLDRDSAFRKGEPSPPKPPKPPKGAEDDRDRRGGGLFDRGGNRGTGPDRDSIFRRGNREDRGGSGGRGGDVRTLPSTPDNDSRRRGAERPGAGDQTPSIGDSARREAARREAERRDNDRREASRKSQEDEGRRRQEAQRQEAQRQESQRRERERPGRRSYQDFPSSPSTGAGGRDNAPRRSYRDFPGSSGAPQGRTYTPPSSQPDYGSRRSFPSRSYGGDRGGGSSPSYTPSRPSYTPPSGGSSSGSGRSYSPPSRGGSSGGGRSYGGGGGSSRSSGGGGGGSRSSGGSDRGGGGRGRR